MGGNRVSPRTEQFISDTYNSLKKQYKKPTGQQVLNAAKADIAANNRKDIELPSKRKIQYMMHDIDERGKGLSKEEQIQQKPWTMVSLNEFPLPNDSIPYVLHVWRYCCHTDENFTIRQAKWVSRLFRLLPQVTPNFLWSISYTYSKKEELSVLSGIPCDTFIDDVGMVMINQLEVQTLLEVHHNTQSWLDIYSISIPINRDGLLIDEVAHPIEYYNALAHHSINNKRDMQLIDMLGDLPTLFELNLDPSIFMRYLSWITFIKKTSDWSKLTAEQSMEIIGRLRGWAIKQNENIKLAHEPSKYDVETVEDKGDLIHYQKTLPRPEEVLNLLSKYANKG
jgi:hypothetical protein